MFLAGQDGEGSRPAAAGERPEMAASPQTRQLPGPEQQKGVYVFGISPAEVELATGMRGVGDPPGPVRALRCDALAALVS